MPLTLAGTPAINGLAVPTDTLSSGLVLITSQTFSAASTVSVNNCFSSTYDNYRIAIRLRSITNNGFLQMRLRASGTDNTASAQYTTGMNGATNVGNASIVAAADSFWYVIQINSAITTGYYSATMDLFDPGSVNATGMGITSSGVNSSPNGCGNAGGGYHTVVSAFDGFTIYPTSGNVTGTLRVYGYRNA